jgi:hypothetical protein
VFRCFTAAAPTEAGEAEGIERWRGHMEEVKRRLGFVGSPRVFHWSPAEQSAYATAYNSAKARHPTGRGRTRGSAVEALRQRRRASHRAGSSPHQAPGGIPEDLP